MMKRLTLGLGIVTLAFLGLMSGRLVTEQIFNLSSNFAQAAPNSEQSQKTRYKNLELFQKVLHFVENNYVDEIQNEKLVHGAIKGMLQELDPHSNFLSAEIFKDMKIDTSGEFGGLGIEIGMRDNVLTIIAPIEDTPAWNAGLKPLDRIIKIAGESTKGLTLMEAVNRMRGKKGTKVTLTIYRRGFEKMRDVEITRDIIKIRAVKFEPLEKNYGYVRLTNFNERASGDVANAIKKIEKSHGKLKGLILDLRTNPGGLLDQAVEVTSLFVKEGAVVSTVGRDRNQKEVKHVRKGKARTDFPIAVLVNSSTASAAEIVAGALQDHGRAVILGEPTFGKGSVQTVIDLGENMGLKLTIARYYTPSGRNIQEEGVVPDIELDQYDPKLLAKAKIERESTREKDLPGHIAATKKSDKQDFTRAELDALGKKGKDSEEEVDDMAPIKYNPKEDFQVTEALNYLKSYQIFQKNLKKKLETANR